MHARWAIALTAALVAALATRGAHAWQEAHQTGDDAHIVVDAKGIASVEDELRWHVQRGPLRSIDVTGFPPSAVVEPKVSIAAADGRTLSGHAVRRDEGTVHITVDDPRALARGTFTFGVRARIDLVAARSISRDGATWRLAWSGPVAADGVDSVRVTIDLPAAPEEPRPIAPDTGAIDDSVVATIRRGADRDVLELVRPHLAGGESPTWTVRVDPRALSLVADPRVRPPPEANLSPEPDRMREASLAALLVAVAVSFGLLVGCKARAFASVCAAGGGRPRSLLPLPDRARAVLAGVALAGAVGLEAAGEITAGAACASVAALAAALRAPEASPPVRGPGRWLALRPEHAFAPSMVLEHWLDIGSVIGRLTALGAGALVVAMALLARRFDADAPWLAAVDATALVPLFVTGRAAQLPPHGMRSAVPWLSWAFRRLRGMAGLRVTPWARVAPDGVTADELRLLVMPRVAMPGVIGLEIGLAWSSTPVCWAATPEVLVRVVDGSEAARRLARDVPHVRSVPGRRPDERVIRLLPRAPTRSSTVALTRALAEALTGGRCLSADPFAIPPSGVVAVREYGSSPRRRPRSGSTEIHHPPAAGLARERENKDIGQISRSDGEAGAQASWCPSTAE